MKRKKNNNYTIRRVHNRSEMPFGLLLLADETVEAIEKYLYNSEVYIVTETKKLQPIAVFVLFKINTKKIEIKNIAVREELQGNGIGSHLIEYIRQIAADNNYKEIIVGTPEHNSHEIKFYQKNGFKKYGLKKDFFLRNYRKPIIENGILLRNMVMLKLELEWRTRRTLAKYKK